MILTHVITVKFMGGLEATLRAEAQPKLERLKGAWKPRALR